MKTYEPSEQLSLLPSTSSARGSPVKTCQEPAVGAGGGSEESAPGSGENSPESSTRCARDSASSKMSRAVKANGCAQCGPNCMNSAIERAPWGLPPAIAGRLISDRGSSLLPTPTASSYGTSLNGCPHDGREEFSGKGKPSLETMARRGLWPTPTATANATAPYMQRWPGHRALLEDQPTGQLNPTWVAWLEWTGSALSETPLFRNALKWSEK